MLWPSPTPPAALQVRRTKLANALGDVPAILFAGVKRARNYPANTYPYRAESHFLYLAGVSLPGAAILVDGGKSTLFVVAPEPDDPLWHGEVASMGDLRTLTGVDDVVAIDRARETIG